MRPRQARAGRAVAVIIALALGASVGVVVAGVAKAERPETPTVQRPDVSAAREPMTAAITTGQVVEREAITAPVQRSVKTLTIADAGVVTELHVTNGAPLTSGALIATIQDEPLIALSMRFPLWRDVNEGDEGSDVEELHTALRQLGFYKGRAAEPANPGTVRALARVDKRLSDFPVRASLIAPITSGAVLAAEGVTVGTRLGGDLVVGVRTGTSQLVVSDGGAAGQWVTPPATLVATTADGVQWTGTVTSVGATEDGTVLDVTSEAPVPAALAVIEVQTSVGTENALLAPKAGLLYRPDGTTYVRSAGRDVSVSVGLCGADLCEISGDGVTDGLSIEVPSVG